MRAQSEYKEEQGVGFFVFPDWERLPFVTHFFSTRKGGNSKGSCATLNLDFRDGDTKKAVSENRKLVCDALGVDRDIHFVEQIHGDGIHLLTSRNLGKSSTTPVRADAILTDLKDVPIGVLTADCVPILLLDSGTRAIGVVHAGRKGTEKKILSKTISKMIEQFNIQVEDLFVGIGPSIGQCCYEVGQECLVPFQKNPLLAKQAIRQVETGKFYLDLIQLNVFQLLEFHIPNQNIYYLDVCTACRTDLFYSHRGENSQTGRFVSGLFLRSK